MAVPEQQTRLLVVDDAADTREVLQRNLTSNGYKVFTAGGVSEAVRLLETASIDLVITDLKMPGASGFDLIHHVRENYPDTEVMMITGYPSIEGAVKAVKSGAEDYLAKPFTQQELQTAVKKTLDKLEMKRASQAPSSRIQPIFGLIGESTPMRAVIDSVLKAAGTSATVLITGESGTGKELVARAIHYKSARASAPFVPVNCGGIPEDLLESALFGHVKGAFTGATETRAGFFQTADGGAIFLDEISETTPAMQVKLLRVLQDKEVTMVGSTRASKLDVRILAATNKDLPALVERGAFREDLFYRLNVLSIGVPPLRERGDDILLIANHLVRKYSKEFAKPGILISERAMAAMKRYPWPGNVRELENTIQRAVVMADGAIIDVPDLPSFMRHQGYRETGLDRTLSEVEAEHIRNVLASVGGNKTRAAAILGIDRKTLRQKVNRFSDSGDS
jgi:two-component system response regulator HydG